MSTPENTMTRNRIARILGKKCMGMVSLEGSDGDVIIVPNERWMEKRHWKQITKAMSVYGYVWVRDAQRWRYDPWSGK